MYIKVKLLNSTPETNIVSTILPFKKRKIVLTYVFNFEMLTSVSITSRSIHNNRSYLDVSVMSTSVGSPSCGNSLSYSTCLPGKHSGKWGSRKLG